jgi:C4-type Zn-finger protein
MPSLTVTMFSVTNRCPVCGGAANARYHRPAESDVAHMKRKCGDCGFTWEEKAVARSL